MFWYTTEKLGNTQSLTPEGFLLCENVPIARTGPMMYAPGEIPVTPGADGYIRVTRDAGDVFAPATIASFQGKPLVNDHPDEKVTPMTWRALSIGSVINPRQGQGTYQDLLFADLLVTDPQAIQDIRQGKREVSCGYDADYEELSPGHGRQHNIIGNHVALVQTGRCGPRCSIGDSRMPKTIVERIREAFTTQNKATLDSALTELNGGANSSVVDGIDGMLPDPAAATPGAHRIIVNVHGGQAGGAGGQGGPVAAVAPPAPGADAPNAAAPAAPPTAGATPPPGAGQSANTMEQRLASMEAAMQNIQQMLSQVLNEEDDGGEQQVGAEGEQNIPPEKDSPTGDSGGELTEPETVEKVEGALGKPLLSGVGKDKKTTKDSSELADTFQDVITRAEILSPGIQFPTFDAASPHKTTQDSICGLQRAALGNAYKTADGKKAIEPFSKATTFDAMPCDALNMVFMGASELAKRQNITQVVRGTVGDTSQKKGPPTVAEINQRNKEFWAKRGSGVA